MNKGSLVVVGTGIRTVGHMTVESVAWLRQADRVLYVVDDPIAEDMIKELNPSGAESLSPYYDEVKPCIQTYQEMVERILDCVRQGMLTCLACYRHPGVFVYPSHESVRRTRAKGFAATMLPGISSEDCLFADPGIGGCQPTIVQLSIAMLGQVPMSAGYTLYIPPAVSTMADPLMYARMQAMTRQAS